MYSTRYKTVHKKHNQASYSSGSSTLDSSRASVSMESNVQSLLEQVLFHSSPPSGMPMHKGEMLGAMMPLWWGGWPGWSPWCRGGKLH